MANIKLTYPYHLSDVYNTLFSKTIIPFINVYQNIILQDYNIFPVPKYFIQDIIQFIINSNVLQQKEYLCKEILQKYTKNWKYYSVFKFNFQRMIKKNISASIKVIKYNTYQELQLIIKKYQPNSEYIKNTIKITQSKALIYDYSNNFKLILVIKENYSNNRNFQYYKAIQHQLIHWMQIVLNAESYTTYGVFNKIQNILTKEDIQFLNKSLNTNNIENNAKYMLEEMQFQAWCANAIQVFQFFNLNLQKFKSIIQNKNSFKSNILKMNEQIRQLYIFAEICYLASLNNPADDRYWYLIQAIKQNKLK